ncbi:type II secretion system minor pseudopilin GspH [Ectothiorhodospiraceae bacterium WFHF3C12]|nr:type II secretion system minor pseudopilin GspH [Ectothiorhodospiraceae bacterium WFHF3C12]
MMRRRHRQQRPVDAVRGFTLIELLVVLLIVGVMVGMASLAVGDNRGEVVEREAQRLVALLRLAQDEATLSGQAVGLHVSHDGYAFLAQQDADTWVPMTGDRALAPHDLPEFVRLDMLVDGEPITPGRTGLSGGDGGDDDPGLSGGGDPGLSDSGSESGADSTDADADNGEQTASSGDDEENPEGKEPHTVIYPSGEIYPFQLDVAGDEPGGRYFRITGEIHGEIALETRD